MSKRLTSRALIARDLERIGVTPGSVVIVHSAMSELDYLPGGEQALLLALRDSVGSGGTIVTPAQSWHLCDPAYLADPEVPESWWPDIRAALPSYDAATTPSRAMGLLAEAVRVHPESLRSPHPHRSFAAIGPAAERIVARHDLDDPVGEGSPLAILYELRASVLLLGVGYAACTALHLAGSRSGTVAERVANGAPLLVDGEQRWVTFDEPSVRDADFPQAGVAFEADLPDDVSIGMVGGADARLVAMRSLVDYCADWMRDHRD